LRRASKRFWLLVSVVAVLMALQGGLQAMQRGRVNELTLAGLRPGHDKNFGTWSQTPRLLTLICGAASACIANFGLKQVLTAS
jgi:hypothetical protein